MSLRANGRRNWHQLNFQYAWMKDSWIDHVKKNGVVINNDIMSLPVKYETWCENAFNVNFGEGSAQFSLVGQEKTIHFYFVNAESANMFMNGSVSSHEEKTLS
jgi:hypothetical protein